MVLPKRAHLAFSILDMWAKWADSGADGSSGSVPLLYDPPSPLPVVNMPDTPCDPAVCKVKKMTRSAVQVE